MGSRETTAVSTRSQEESKKSARAIPEMCNGETQTTTVRTPPQHKVCCWHCMNMFVRQEGYLEPETQKAINQCHCYSLIVAKTAIVLM